MFSHMNWAVAFKHARARKWECVCLEIKMKKNVTSTSSNIMENVIVQSTPYCILYACLVCLAGVVLLPRFKEKIFVFSVLSALWSWEESMAAPSVSEMQGKQKYNKRGFTSKHVVQKVRVKCKPKCPSDLKWFENAHYMRWVYVF